MHIVALGARTCVGRRAATSAAAVSAGINRLTEHPYFVDRAGDPIVTASDRDLCTEALSGRLQALVGSAIDEACASLPALDGQRYAVRLALPPPRPGVPVDVEALVQAVCRERLGHGSEIRTSSRSGHAGGLVAIADARDLIARDEIDVCLVVSADSYLDIDTLEWMEAERMLHARGTGSAFVPGEAASVCVLASTAIRRARRWPSYGTIPAVAVTHEPPPTAPDSVSTGAALADAILQVVAAGDGHPSDIYCDLNGQRNRADEYGFAALRVRRHVHDPGAFVAPCRAWGDVGAATGPLLVTLAACRARRGRARGGRALVWCASDLEDRAALLVQSDVNDP